MTLPRTHSRLPMRTNAPGALPLGGIDIQDFQTG